MSDLSARSTSDVKIAAEMGDAAGALRAELVPTSPSAALPCESDFGRRLAVTLALVSAVLFVVGIFAPSFTMIPKLGDGYFERFVRLFMRNELAPRSFSLVSGIWRLLRDGELLIGAVILIFSVIFPAAKLAALALSLRVVRGTAERHLGALEHLGKWSMLDVFVIAALVVCFKGFPGGTHIQVDWGIYVFAASVVLSMLATRSMRLWHRGDKLG
jgi:Paraquat-inducible protein A